MSVRQKFVFVAARDRPATRPPCPMVCFVAMVERGGQVLSRRVGVLARCVGAAVGFLFCVWFYKIRVPRWTYLPPHVPTHHTSASR